jgi:hypothetical protein
MHPPIFSYKTNLYTYNTFSMFSCFRLSLIPPHSVLHVLHSTSVPASLLLLTLATYLITPLPFLTQATSLLLPLPFLTQATSLLASMSF